ncbi:hypothetical protein BC936DRAFT_136661 [Jimgerdemannia flammicorona]|uniref:RING-type E3 ubiquitin transferase n=1 Tax=Jimgerdemannia flammicorona TaxID=994334 RepID=A0A433CZ20_9FUNG|nr:hypothetical protein BC936DRAFT_136661 [Jimgerdemannia flammicorona]
MPVRRRRSSRRPRRTTIARTIEIKVMNRPLLDSVLPPEEFDPERVTNTACVICLDELDSREDTRMVRRLPCGHGFCIGCIGEYEWLTTKSTLCPICKRDCVPSKDTMSSSSAGTHTSSCNRDEADIITPSSHSTTEVLTEADAVLPEGESAKERMELTVCVIADEERGEPSTAARAKDSEMDIADLRRT